MTNISVETSKNDDQMFIYKSDEIYHKGKRLNILPLSVRNMLIRYKNRHKCNNDCVFILDDEGYYCPKFNYVLDEEYQDYYERYVFGGTQIELINEWEIERNIGLNKKGKPSIDDS